MRPGHGQIGAGIARVAAATAVVTLLAFPVRAVESDEFPDVRPSSRAEFERLLASDADDLGGSLSVHLARSGIAATGTASQALRSLRGMLPPVGEAAFALPDGTPVTLTSGSSVIGAGEPADRNEDGVPDVVAPIARAWSDAGSLLHHGLDLDRPEGLRVVLGPIAGAIDGYTVPRAASGATTAIVLDDADRSDGGESLYRAAIREYAFAVMSAHRPRLEPGWVDAFARWVTVRVAGPDGRALTLFDERRDRWTEGLYASDARLAAGNAFWLAWLDEAIGTRAVAIMMEELAAGEDHGAILTRVARRAAGVDGSVLLREFQVWSALTGSRFDGTHFSFADRIGEPSFVSDVDWLPAFSVQSDPPIAPFGGSVFRIAPEHDRGGITVRFEGGFGAAWSVDLLIRSRDGSMHRVPLPLESGRGEVTVPLHGMDESLLLVRNDGSDAETPARFTWAAYPVRGFPFELGRFDARWIDGDAGGVLVSWETSIEQRLLGFDLLRTPARGGVTRRVNPVWIPAIGDPTTSAGYQFIDATADPGVSYVYRIEGITLEGLRSVTEPLLVSAPHPAH